MDLSNQFIFFGAVLILASILASVFSSRFGTPILLVFLVLGMLAGEDGPGGIQFNDFQVAYLGSTLRYEVETAAGLVLKADVRDPWHHDVLAPGRAVRVGFPASVALMLRDE